LSQSDAAQVAVRAPVPRSPAPRHRWRSLLGEALATALPWASLQLHVAYLLRTTLAISIALYTAFSLQLESPFSSVVTVLIVANPSTGALLSKSFWRMFGTLIGGVVAVVMMAVFAQSPVLFSLVFAAGVGVACLVASLTRYFRAYAVVLTAYTVIIVCTPAFNDPLNVFVSALSRMSAVFVGIVSAALVFLLTSARQPARLAHDSLALVHEAAAALAGHAASPPDGGERPCRPGTLDERLYAQREALFAQTLALNETIEYAAADDLGVARQARSLRLGVARMMGALAVLNPFFGRTAAHPDLARTLSDAIAPLAGARPGEMPAALERVAALRDRLAAGGEATGPASFPADAPGGTLEDAHDLLSRLHESVWRLVVAPGDRPVRPPRRALPLFLDWNTALRNGVRGFLVTLIGMLFWYVSKWPSAPTALVFLVSASCLLSTNPSAASASKEFALGTVFAIPVSYVCQAFLLSRISGYPLLIGSLMVCLLPGIWFQVDRRYTLRAFGYVVYLCTMVSVNNPVRLDDLRLVNDWLGFSLASAALVVVFRALLPADAVRDSDRLLRSITASVVRLCRTGPPPEAAAWENMQMQKAARLLQRLGSLPPEARHRALDAALIAVVVGRCLISVRDLLPATILAPAESRALGEALRAIRGLRRDPSRAAHEARAAAGLILARPQAPLAARRLAALLCEVAMLIDSAGGYLQGDFSVRSLLVRRC